MRPLLMLTQEMIVTIKVLKQQGKSIKGIARETSLARNTVKKYLQQTDSAPVYQRNVARPSKLDHNIPNQRLLTEQAALLPLPMRIGSVYHPQASCSVVTPFESLQHPLSIYDQLLRGTHELTI